MKKCLLAVVVVFVVMFGCEWVIHDVILKADYAGHASLYRPQEEMGKYFPLMLVAYLMLAAALVWIYEQGKKSNVSFLHQGLRFGLAMAAVASVPNLLIYYAVMPISCALLCKQLVFTVTEVVGLGVLVAWLRK